ncbi:DUF2927 domain-containing protein [Chachezhania antarctica]|uniref:DUF2927 domain-containing protein n=1 Tax=Chachezhania antarctica TaxID=2340860 RepID=UPI001F08ABEA|nr:DUF2927 domain-containing protein [Chachezhania antarctica]
MKRFGLILATLSGLSAVGCDLLPGETPPETTAAPAPAAPAAPAARTSPSAESQVLSARYAEMQRDLLARGLLRVDGGGPDTPFTARDLATNFEAIAFYDEYARGGSARRADGWLSRWALPVKVELRFGPMVPDDVRTTDRAQFNAYVRRLARVTGHPVTSVQRDGNFIVFVGTEDDKAYVQKQLKMLMPGISETELALFRDLPDSRHCQVVTHPASDTPYVTATAVSLVRAEQPDLMRRACLHEELAQGLGLRNDSPGARPSIFNDDDEFAQLTTHDEQLLKILYDPRLKPGMTVDEARPMVEQIALELAPPAAF